MVEKERINVGRFEVVVSNDGNEALVCFSGRTIVAEGALAWLEDGMLLVDRSPHPPLCFGFPDGLLQADTDLLERASVIYVNRVFEETDNLTRIHLTHAP